MLAITAAVVRRSRVLRYRPVPVRKITTQITTMAMCSSTTGRRTMKQENTTRCSTKPAQIARLFRQTTIALSRRICQSSMPVVSRSGQHRDSFSGVIVLAASAAVMTMPTAR